MNKNGTMGLPEIIALAFVVIIIIFAVIFLTKGDPFGSLAEIFKPR